MAARTPRAVRPSTATWLIYIMTVNANTAPIDVHLLDYPDKEINELVARGIGEIALAGVAAAITEADPATGIRVRELPVKIEDSLVEALH